MIDLIYTYNSPKEILNNLTFIKDFDIIWYIIITFLIIIFSLIIIYLLPIFYIIKEQFFKNIEKKKKKELLKQIVMQKELEDEILKEVKKH